jgi:hypothetical protein
MEFKTFIPLPLYDYRIYVIFTESLKETSKVLISQGLLAKNTDMGDETTGAFHIKFSNQSYSYLVFKMNADSNQITHECYHAVSTLFKWIGATHEEELFAYHLGYLVREVTKDQSAAIKKLQKALDKLPKP